MAKKETVIQFGEGGFLRGFVDYFFQKLKDKGMFDGSVVVVQPIEKGMCEMLEKQGCEYNLFLRGIDNGEVVDEHTHINVISRCVNPYTDNEAYMKLAENPDFRVHRLQHHRGRHRVCSGQQVRGQARQILPRQADPAVIQALPVRP